jgi:hypothetical protein
MLVKTPMAKSNCERCGITDQRRIATDSVCDGIVSQSLFFKIEHISGSFEP